MKIVLVVHGFPPSSIAGVELYTYMLARELAKAHEVHVFARLYDNSRKEYSILRSEREGIHITEIVHNLATPQSFAGSYRNSEIENAFSAWLQSVRPDVVHFQHSYLLSASLIAIAHEAGCPVILTLHDYWYVCPSITLMRADGGLCDQRAGQECLRCFYSQHPPKETPMGLPVPTWAKKIVPLPVKNNMKRAFRVLSGSARRQIRDGVRDLEERDQFMKRMLLLPNRIITPSEFMKVQYIRLGFSEDQMVQVVPYGIITEKLANIPKSHGSKVRFAFLGSVLRHKGLHMLIQAFNRLPDGSAELHIHGDYSFDPVYYRQCKKLCVRRPIVFHGAYSPGNLPEIFSGIDCAVVSSICWETGPLTLLESLASKTPAVVPDASGPKEIIGSYGGGLLYLFRDGESLYRRLQEIINRPSIVTELASSIRPIRNQSDQAHDMLRIYERATR